MIHQKQVLFNVSVVSSIVNYQLPMFSCSGLVSPDLFQKIVFSASLEAECDVQIVEKLGQASDHSILVTLPESEYLKGFVCRVI